MITINFKCDVCPKTYTEEYYPNYKFLTQKYNGPYLCSKCEMRWGRDYEISTSKFIWNKIKEYKTILEAEEIEKEMKENEK